VFIISVFQGYCLVYDAYKQAIRHEDQHVENKRDVWSGANQKRNGNANIAAKSINAPPYSKNIAMPRKQSQPRLFNKQIFMNV